MLKASRQTRGALRPETEALFARASEQWDRGKLTSAFRLFLSGAHADDPGAELNLGYFYDTGIAVRRNRGLALYWYKRAYRHGYGAAATNIGTIFRDEHQTEKALAWFRRAVRLGDADANLEIAKMYLRREKDAAKAVHYLNKTCKSNQATEGSKEQARLLLTGLKNKKTKHLHPQLNQSSKAARPRRRGR